MSYVETKKKLDALRSNNEMMFRMAVSHLLDVGIRHLTESSIEHTCEQIMEHDDSKSLMTNSFQCELLRLAGELAKVDHIELLCYIGDEIYYDVGPGRTGKAYDIQGGYRLELIGNCVDVFEDFLESKEIWIDNEDREGNEGEAIIYGMDYDAIADRIEDVLVSWGLIEKDNRL